MRIAMIGPRGIPSTYGGIERHVEAIAPRLAAKGHRVTVYARRYATGPGTFQGVEIRPIPTLRTKNLDTAVYTLLATLDALRRDLDILHFHGIGPALFAVLPRAAGLAVVVTVHGLDWQRPKWGPLARLTLRGGEVASVRVPSATIVVSRTLEAHYRRRHGIETCFIPNGVDLPSLSGDAGLVEHLGLATRKYLLFVGRLVPEKGVHILLRAFARVRCDLRLAIAGAPAYTEDYADHLRALARGDPRVRLLGFVEGEALRQLYAQAYAFVLPSDLEGQSIALLEAMSHGLPVVVSDLPENLEVILSSIHGPAGLSFRRGDDIDLAERLAGLVHDPTQAESLGRSARRVVTGGFRWDSVVNRLEEVYRRVLLEHRR